MAVKNIWKKLQSNIPIILLYIKHSMPGKRFTQTGRSFKESSILKRSVEKKHL